LNMTESRRLAIKWSAALLLCSGLWSCASHSTPQRPKQSIAASPEANAATSDVSKSTPTPGAGTAQRRATSKVVQPFPDVAVRLDPDPQRSSVEIRAWTCLDEGLLEQVACGPDSREHESLLVIKAKPSHIHAALLLAGFEPGAPGQWTYDNNTLGTIAPTGEKLDIDVRYVDRSGQTIEHSVRNWIRDTNGVHAFPADPWVFGGSSMRTYPPSAFSADAGASREHYVADMTGSIIGLVTFGDEVIGFSKVFADSDAVQPPQWQVNAKIIPPLNTEVTVIVRRFQAKGIGHSALGTGHWCWRTAPQR
jgi:hypothetical protein